MSQPWFKFWPADWRQDPALNMCSLAARGLWIEMLALMHQATPYGHLLVNGQPPTEAQLAVLVGDPSGQLPDLLGELERAGIFSRTRAGVIYSRKMTRMAKKAATAQKNGRKGGNPTLSKEKGKTPSDNRQDKGEDKTQKPEARSQTVEGTVVPFGASGPQMSPKRFEEFWGLYPHRHGRKTKRKDAERKYARLVRDGVAEADIIEGAWRAQSDSEVQRGYSRDPTTWLNQEGWKDEIPAASDETPTSRGAPRHDRAEQRRRNHATAAEVIRRYGSGEIQRGVDESDPFPGQ